MVVNGEWVEAGGHRGRPWGFAETPAQRAVMRSVISRHLPKSFSSPTASQSIMRRVVATGGLITVAPASVSFQQAESDALKQIFSGAGLLTRVSLKRDLFLQKTSGFLTHASTRKVLKGRFKMVWGGRDCKSAVCKAPALSGGTTVDQWSHQDRESSYRRCCPLQDKITLWSISWIKKKISKKLAVNKNIYIMLHTCNSPLHKSLYLVHVPVVLPVGATVMHRPILSVTRTLKTSSNAPFKRLHV